MNAVSRSTEECEIMDISVYELQKLYLITELMFLHSVVYQ